MRKWRMLCLALALLGAAAMLVAWRWVNAGGRNVTLTETLLEGDADAFQGIELTAYAQLGWNAVHWETTLRPGEPSESRCFYKTMPRPEPAGWEPSMSVSLDVFHGTWTEVGSGLLHFAADRLAQQAPGTGPYLGSVSARELCPTLPLHFFWNGDYGTMHDVDDTLCPLFQIPTPEDWTVKLNMTVAETEGNPPTRYAMLNDEDAAPGEGRWPTLECLSAGRYDENSTAVIYFTLDCSLPGGGALDLSGVPNGGGIYRFESKGNTLETVFPFPAETKPWALWQSEDGGTLYFVSTLNGETTLRTFALPEMTERQAISLLFPPEAELLEPIQREGLALIPETNGLLEVLSMDDSGLPHHELLLDTAEDPALQPGNLGGQTGRQNWELRYSALREDTWFAVKNGRFVLAAPAQAEWPEDSLDLLLSVYDETGRQGTLLLENSLTPEIRPDYNSGNPFDQRAIRLESPGLVIRLD